METVKDWLKWVWDLAVTYPQVSVTIAAALFVWWLFS